MVPPPLQGHTPDIVPPFDPDLARAHLGRSGVREGVELAAPAPTKTDRDLAAAVAASWEDVLGVPVRVTHDAERAGAAAIVQTGWFPGYPDPEYFLRLLLHSAAMDNHGSFASPAFDELIELARGERDGRARLERFHAADRMAVAEEVAAIPLLYVRNPVFLKPWTHGWWEYGKAWSSFADLVVDERSPRSAGRDER
jgi:oligopeptide transport system substrate-binding protein